jgi:hypothetical protein
MGLTNFSNGISSFGIPIVGTGIPFPGKYFFVNPSTGSDGNTGLNPSKALKTLYKAYSLCTSGNNDVVFLIGDGGTTATARLSKTLAQGVSSSATTGTLTWAKNATHLIGVAAPTVNGRARIAPVSTDTMAGFGSGNFVVVTAQGCLFQNITAFNGFATGGNSQICWTDSGGRNSYVNCSFSGMGDAESAITTTGRSLLLSGNTGESTFTRCTIGNDAQVRTNATVELEFATNAARHQFYDCVIQTSSSDGASFWVKVGTSGLDRYALFNNCTFTNNVIGGATVLAVGISAAASPGGPVLLQNCMTYGCTKIDTAQKTYVNQANAATAGAKGSATES